VKLESSRRQPLRRALFLRELVRYSACFQLLDGLAFLLGLADAGSSRRFGGLGQLERALPVLRRFSHSPRQGCAQALPVAFAEDGVGDDSGSGCRRLLLRFLFQCMARQFGRGIQALLLVLARTRAAMASPRALLASFSALRRRFSKTARLYAMGSFGDVASVDT